MERLLLECSIRAALVALCAAAILSAMRVRSAAARHAVWAGVAGFMLVLPLWAAWGPKAAMPFLPAELLPAKPHPVQESPTTGRQMEIDEATNPADGSSTNARRTSAPAPVQWPWAKILLWGYATGALWLLLRLVIGTVRMRRLSGADCVAPVTVGLFRPRVILPEGWKEWSPRQLDAILEHEHAHVRRRDPLVQWLALLNRALFWFHPLAWSLERKLAELAEEACDTAVLERGHDPAEYAECLLDMERSVKRAGARALALGMAMPGAGLPRRIRLIFDGPRPTRVSRMKIACIAVACSATAVVFGAGTLKRGVELQLPPMQLPAVPAPEILLAQARATSAPATSQPAAAARPKFDVVSVRRCLPGDELNGPGGRGGPGGGGGGRGPRYSPGRLRAQCLAVSGLIRLAYLGVFGEGLLNYNPPPSDTRWLRNAPAWVNKDWYTVEGVTNDPVASGPTGPGHRDAEKRMEQMLQPVLEDRFQLKIHRATEDVPMYNLVVAKGGFKLKPMEKGGCIERDPTKGVTVSQMFSPGQTPLCVSWLHMNGPDWAIDSAGQKLSNLAAGLSNILNRHVFDKTGIDDVFIFHLQFAHDEITPGNFPPEATDSLFPPTDTPSGPSIFTALEGLGLKLEPTSGPQGYIVIDRVERPSEN